MSGRRRRRGEPYEVGYARPPKEHQFQKGNRSANPLRRPRKVRHPLQDFADVLEERRTLNVDGAPMTKTLRQWVLFSLSRRAAGGNLRAIKMLEGLYADHAAAQPAADVTDYSKAARRFLALADAHMATAQTALPPPPAEDSDTLGQEGDE